MKELTDTQMLDWCEKNPLTVDESRGRFVVEYSSNTLGSAAQTVSCFTLRDCIRKVYYE